MDYLSILKTYGHEKDMCMREISKWFIENPGVHHKDNVARVPFRSWNMRKGKYDNFSIDTILRKTRRLAEIGILQKDNTGSHGSTRYWVGNITSHIPKRVEQVMIDGVMHARLI